MPTRLNFARMRTTTGGTGTMALLPVTGKPTFNQALANTTGTFTDFKYTFIDQGTGAYEIGSCTYTAPSLEISSRTVTESWPGSGNVGTSLINFGTSNIFVYCGVFHQDIVNAGEAGATSLGQLSDVDDSVATTNNFVLVANGSAYGSRQLATTDLSDVSEVTGAANNDMLMWSNTASQWVVKTTANVKSVLNVDKVSLPIEDSAPADGTIQLTLNAPYPGTINSLTHKLASGSTTIAIKINAANVTGLSAVSPTSTKTTTNATGTNTFVTGDEITLVYSSSSTPGKFSGSLNITK